MTGAPPTSTPPPGAGPLWGNHGGGATPAAPTPEGGPGGDRLDPLSRRLLRLAGLLSVLLLLVLANSLFHEDEGALELNPVAAAAERVEHVGGGRMSLYVVYSSPALPRPVSASGGGVFNEKTDRSRIVLHLRNPFTGEALHIVEVQDGESKYEGGSEVEKALPPGKKWVHTDKSEESGEDETPLNMEDSMKMLDSSGEVRLVGHESVNGKMTRRYRGEVQIIDLVDVLREKGKDTEADAYERIEGTSPVQVSAEAWVDRRNMLRRMRIVMPMPGKPGQPSLTVDMRMDFFAYGTEPEIALPDPETVVEGPLDTASASGSIS